MKKAIHFGAGNIGRGFIGFLLSKSDYHLTLIDIDENIIRALQQHYINGHVDFLDISDIEDNCIAQKVEGIYH